ncbi:hypothetical protein [Butyrivibrio sp. LC3010]|uniref:hypothetical protein n=1 Tax=Butyrivibrio sp. LC3010 TaxID=1280680 RepID=UPI000418F2D8|nr:hypothetical protein [Butyrivibrio sp. LC3010]
MKKVIDKGKIFAIVFITVLLASLFLIVSMLKTSNDLREFKVNLFVLCNESNICVVNGKEGKFKMSQDNLAALNSLMTSTRGQFTLSNPEPVDSISFDFKHDEDDWNLEISDVGNNMLRVVLEGPEKYRVYIKNNKKYDEFLKAASAEGYHSPNKKIGN